MYLRWFRREMVNSIYAFEETFSRQKVSWKEAEKSEVRFCCASCKWNYFQRTCVPTVGAKPLIACLPPALQTYLSQSSTSHSSLTKPGSTYAQKSTQNSKLSNDYLQVCFWFFWFDLVGDFLGFGFHFVLLAVLLLDLFFFSNQQPSPVLTG